MAGNTLRESLHKFTQNLNTLREREAKYAGNAPLDLLNQIEDHQTAIDKTEQALAGKLSEAEWREALQPLLVAIDRRAAASEICQVTIGDIIAGRDVHLVIYNYPSSPPVPEPEPAEAEEDIPACPYRGLFAFRPEHAPFFFGRETFSQSLVTAVESRRLVVVLGASGSGKSSVVFAGLVPSLLNRPGEPWLFTTFRPGDDPFLSLAGALTPLYEESLSKTKQLLATRGLSSSLRAGELSLADVFKLIQQAQPDQRLLLIADQFEELYTLCRESDGRQQFLDTLLTIVGANSHSPLAVHLVLTLRADFLGQALMYRPLADALQDTDLKLGPMTRAEMTAAIEKPAGLQGVSFETNLVDRLLDDIGAEEGSLPLLEFALTELWQHQTRRTLTHVAYEEIGEVKGALSRHADKAYQRLSPAEQEQARRVFVQLVNPGAGTEDTRRLATRAELAQNWSLVARLANERLVVTNQLEDEQDTVEVVHEVLIRHWDQLRLWMAEDRTFRAWQERLRAALRQWQASEQDEGALLRGAPLAEAEQWLAERPDDVSRAEQDFINTGLKQRRKKERRQRIFLGVAVAAAVVMAVLAGLSLWFYGDASQQRATAEAERDNAATAKAEAEAAGTAVAKQNEKAQAELNFYQTTDPKERLLELHNLFNKPDPDSQAKARQLFFALPEVDQWPLLRVEDERLVAVIKELSGNLADVNRTGHTDQHLTATIETLTNLPAANAADLKTSLDQWLDCRDMAREENYKDALAEYDALIELNADNPALLYERAGVRAELGDYPEALADLEQVLALAANPTYTTVGMMRIGPEFANTDQMQKAVQRLIYVTPDLAATFKNAEADYPNLARIGLLPEPTVKTDAKKVPMVKVKAGSFKMGSYTDYYQQSVHQVDLEDFYIDQYEVTNAQYATFLNEQGNREERGVTWLAAEPNAARIHQNEGQWQAVEGFANHPVFAVSWYGANAYCQWRDPQESTRLPTEAEWEKAARGEDERTHPWGEHITCDLANYSECDYGTMPVGSFPAGVSPYGAYDMAGNVWEWVQSEYRSYPYHADDGRENLTSTNDRMIRGGSWNNNWRFSRATARENYEPNNRDDAIGFRCAAGVLSEP